MNDVARQQDDNRHPQFTSNLETKLCLSRMRANFEFGDTIPYEEFNKLIGKDVQREGGGSLRSARHIAQRDYQIITEAIPNVGIKRLTDREGVASATGTLRKVRRTAQRGIDRLSAVNFDALPNEDKTMHNASMSALWVTRYMAKPKSVDRIAAAVNTTNTGQLPVARTLELFRGPRFQK